ncbi:hypothetical protein ISN44_As11g035860 [Arabidopsis suecica]|uniref:Uncharacterized protein n=1 Tax=Arabidopsis suecica TaxID=45249 RepID=A0A8T1ZEX8_ARASU|nr:hypothetical protein ISN44_As11g035860 [Arabidopsis suecica]
MTMGCEAIEDDGDGDDPDDDDVRYVSKTVEESSEKKTEVEEKPDINDVPTEDIQVNLFKQHHGLDP